MRPTFGAGSHCVAEPWAAEEGDEPVFVKHASDAFSSGDVSDRLLGHPESVDAPGGHRRLPGATRQPPRGLGAQPALWGARGAPTAVHSGSQRLLSLLAVATRAVVCCRVGRP